MEKEEAEGGERRRKEGEGQRGEKCPNVIK